MAVSAYTPAVYVGNSVADTFAYTFEIPTGTAEVKLYDPVTFLETLLVEGVDYSVSAYDDPAGGTVTYPLSGTKLASPNKIIIGRTLEKTQEFTPTNQDAYSPEALESALDRIVMMIQELTEDRDRTLILSQGETQDPDEIVALLMAVVNDLGASILNLGTLVPTLHNTYDFGQDATRWKDGFFAGNLRVGGALNTNADDVITRGAIQTLSNKSITTPLTIKATAASQSKLVLEEDTDNGANTLTVQPPAALSGNRTFTLPDADVTVSAYIATLLGAASAAASATLLGLGTGDSPQFTRLTLTSADGGAASGPILDIYRDSASPAASDALGEIQFNGEDSAGNKELYGTVSAGIVDPASGSEGSFLALKIKKAGVLSNAFLVGLNAAAGSSPNALGLPGGQLSFPATQNPSADANTFDDYEEGSGTPGVAFGGASVGMTFLSRYYVYVKTAKFVYTKSRIIMTAKGSSTGTAWINGLPFTAQNPNYGGTVQVGYASGMSGLGGGIFGYVEPNNSITTLTGPTATTVASMSDTNFTNASDMIFSVVYEATA